MEFSRQEYWTRLPFPTSWDLPKHRDWTLVSYNSWLSRRGVRKIPWRRECLPTPVFLPEEFHGRRSWWATVRGVTKSQTWPNDWCFHALPLGPSGKPHSLLGKPINRDDLLGQGIVTDCIWKACWPGRWWASVSKNQLARVWALVSFSFIEQGGRGEERKGKRPYIVGNVSWFQPDSGEDVFISSFLKTLSGEPGQDVSCELNKCTAT